MIEEVLRIEKVRVGACLASIAKARGIHRNRDLFLDLGTGLKVNGNNSRIVLELSRCRRIVEGEIKTPRF